MYSGLLMSRANLFSLLWYHVLHEDPQRLLWASVAPSRHFPLEYPPTSLTLTHSSAQLLFPSKLDVPVAASLCMLLLYHSSHFVSPCG